MGQKRINYNGGYLYCSVLADYSVSDIAGDYETAESMYEAYRDNVVAECRKRGYNAHETDAVLTHYEVWICNSGCEFGRDDD